MLYISHARATSSSTSPIAPRYRDSIYETRRDCKNRNKIKILTPWDKRAPHPEDVYTAIAVHSVIGRCARDAIPSTALWKMDVFSYPWWPKNFESLHNTAGTIMAAPLDDKRYRPEGKETAPESPNITWKWNNIASRRTESSIVINCQRIKTAKLKNYLVPYSITHYDIIAQLFKYYKISAQWCLNELQNTGSRQISIVIVKEVIE